jgi:hypothetical protein
VNAIIYVAILLGSLVAVATSVVSALQNPFQVEEDQIRDYLEVQEKSKLKTELDEKNEEQDPFLISSDDIELETVAKPRPQLYD